MELALNPRGFRAVAAAIALCALLPGCMTVKSYVDPALPVVTKASLPTPTQPVPVQVLFEFRTKGNANARATSEVRGRAVAAVAESGMFSSLAAPSEGVEAGQLKIIIDNIADTKSAASKGVGTGLTLGLAGSLVTDGYVCETTYTYAGKTTQTTVEHALHTTIGNHSGPEGLTAMQPQDAVNHIIDQLVWNSLKNLNDKHAFDRE
jgi:hypothetical protein